MAILERRVQEIGIGKWDAYMEWEKQWRAIEERVGGFPPKRHYVPLSGPDIVSTVVWEREWESFAEMEAAYIRLWEDPERKPLTDDYVPLAEGGEYYNRLD